MKKNDPNQRHRRCPLLRKMLNIMKVTTLLFFMALMQVSASSYSQQTRLSLKFEKETLESVFSKIEANSEFSFFYKNEMIQNSNEVTAEFKNVLIFDILDQVLKAENLTYTVRNKLIMIVPKTDGGIENNSQQQKSVSGKVTDTSGASLPGVSVVVKGTTNGTITDGNGNYMLSNIPGDGALVFSFVGMKTQEISVTRKSSIDVAMTEEAIGLDEVVAVGYGTQRKVTTTAAVAALKGEELTRSPVANINNSLVGRLAGVLSFQSSGEPGSDASTLRVRGVGTLGNANALIVIDGIPQSSSSISHINPDEVESITVLKDAAAVAPYGIGGANGVILITTKRGEEGKLSLKYDAYYGVQQSTAIPDYLDAYGYANAVNIANESIGNAPPFSADELAKYKDGSDPDHYPNTDWVNEIINSQAPITKHTLSFTGGSSKVRFYSSLGYIYQEGVISEINYDRYNLLLNVDADVTNTTKVSFDVNGNRRKDHRPADASGSGIFTDVTVIPPIYPLEFTNGLPAHSMLPSLYESGYDDDVSNVLNAKLQGEQKVPFIPGLTLKGVFAYNMGYSFDKEWSLPYTFYKLNAQNEFVPEQAGPIKPSLSEDFNENHQRTIQGYITYERTFGQHDIKLLGVYEGKSGTNNYFSASRVNYDLFIDELSLGNSDKNNFNNRGGSGNSAQMGWVYRLDYSFAEKYLMQLSGRYDGHYYFAPGKRFSFFPSVALGWRLSEEKFIKNNFSWIDNLKLRASYGVSGNLAGGPFQYLTSYQTRNSYVFGGTSPYQVLGIYESAQANSGITWETAKKGDIGFDALLFNGRIDVTFDVFKERRSDMLLRPSEVVPAEYGIGLSQVNAGIMENGGFDFNITYRNNFRNNLRLNTTLIITYAKNKLIETFETSATYNNPNRRRTGRPLDTRFGLQALGLYQLDDFDEKGKLIDGLPTPTFGPVAPGDIKYADIAGPPGENGETAGPDGKINIHDETVIGDPLFPQLIFGLNFNANWKGLDLSMLWQGAGENSVYISNEMASPFFNGAKIFKEQMDYWTPDNPNASHPRLTPAPITNNGQTSSFWVKDGTYLRLKNLELGYTLPESIMKILTIERMRLFVSGQNLITFSQLKFLDPELSNGRGWYYFQQKVFAFGINVTF